MTNLIAESPTAVDEGTDGGHFCGFAVDVNINHLLE
jgi:hypothetical protein